MGLFSWLFGNSRPAVQGHLPGPGTFNVEVVGEAQYQSALSKICGGKQPNGVQHRTQATLVLEDANTYDPQAVRVDISGQTVGYLSRKDARDYRRSIRQQGYPELTASCVAIINGGWDRGQDDQGHFGVRLDLPTV